LVNRTPIPAISSSPMNRIRITVETKPVMGLPLFSMRRIVAVPPPEAFEIIDANREELVQPEFPWIPAFLGRSIAAALAKAQAGTLERPLCGAISRRRDGQLRALLLRGPSS
jgi:hypothetical protein